MRGFIPLADHRRGRLSPDQTRAACSTQLALASSGRGITTSEIDDTRAAVMNGSASIRTNSAGAELDDKRPGNRALVASTAADRPRFRLSAPAGA
jgi:uncharacterized protein YegP (UPF0339 family)